MSLLDDIESQAIKPGVLHEFNTWHDRFVADVGDFVYGASKYYIYEGNFSVDTLCKTEAEALDIAKNHRQEFFCVTKHKIVSEARDNPTVPFGAIKWQWAILDFEYVMHKSLPTFLASEDWIGRWGDAVINRPHRFSVERAIDVVDSARKACDSPRRENAGFAQASPDAISKFLKALIQSEQWIEAEKQYYLKPKTMAAIDAYHAYQDAWNRFAEQ